MSQPGEESGAVEKPVETDWAAALTQTLSKSAEPEAPEAKASSEPDPTDVPTTEETVVSEVRESPDALEPPAKWSDEVKTTFRTLGKVEQQFLLDREKDVESHLTKRTQELSEVQSRYKKLDDVLKPFDEVARQSGIELAPHVAQAMQYYMAYQRDPLSTVKALIQANKLTPEALGLVDDGTDPAVRELRSQLESTRKEIASLKQGTVQATESQYVSQLNSFKDAKDEGGALKHPHYESVRSLMAPLVDQGKSLEEAYSEVVWALPAYRETQLKAKTEQSDKDAKAKAEKARADKVRNAKRAETLAPSDADRTSGLKPVGGNWEKALQETLNKLRS